MNSITNQPVNQSTGQLIDYTLHLADTNLVLSHRNSEWCGHGPVLEQDIAITNISLDLLGQARNFYQYAASCMNAETGSPTTEDALAYLRGEREYKNLLLAELPKGDWGFTLLRQFLYSQFQHLLYEQLQHSADAQLAAIAAKALKETTYHLKWSSEWVIRLGDGTEESHTRMQNALAEIWPYTGEMFLPVNYETETTANGVGVAVNELKPVWEERVTAVLNEATLLNAQLPEAFMQTGGKTGVHTENLGFILAEMQYLQRTHPNCEW